MDYNELSRVPRHVHSIVKWTDTSFSLHIGTYIISKTQSRADSFTGIASVTQQNLCVILI